MFSLDSNSEAPSSAYVEIDYRGRVQVYSILHERASPFATKARTIL